MKVVLWKFPITAYRWQKGLRRIMYRDGIDDIRSGQSYQNMVFWVGTDLKKSLLLFA